jgi:hypothetical protein
MRFPFAFARAYRLPALAFGVTRATTYADLGPDGLRVRFGPWSLRTPLDNVAGVERSGGFAYLKTVGPAHLSFTDRGVTFATNGERAVCVSFHRPVRAIEPFGALAHPGATLTVADPEGFVEELTRLRS